MTIIQNHAGKGAAHGPFVSWLRSTLTCAVLAACLLVAACDTAVKGGDAGDGGHAGGSTTGEPATKLCGTEGGEPCKEGSRCDPAVGCNDFLLGCLNFEEDCTPIDEPRCGPASTGNCDPPRWPLVCRCSGEVTHSCARNGDYIAPDPERCSKGTFSCGASECRQHLDVCVEQAGAEPNCVAATELGCRQYGIADCSCLEGGQEEGACTGIAGEITLVLDVGAE